MGLGSGLGYGAVGVGVTVGLGVLGLGQACGMPGTLLTEVELDVCGLPRTGLSFWASRAWGVGV